MYCILNYFQPFVKDYHNIIVSQIRTIPIRAKDFIINNIIKYFTILPPTVVQFNVTRRCNAKCMMCNIWKSGDKEELDLSQIEKIFSDNLFKNTEYILISGGEPTLRDDLIQIVRILNEKIPKLRKILISSNGLDKRLFSKLIPGIIETCNKKGTLLTITISLDGIGELHDEIRNVRGAFEKTISTIHYLKELQKNMSFRLNVGTTVSRINVYELNSIVEFCEKENLENIFYLAWVSKTYYNNLELKNKISLSQEATHFLTKFLMRQIAQSSILTTKTCYYEGVINMLNGGRRKIPCPFAEQGLVLDANGDIYYCNNSKKLCNALNDKAKNIYYKPENLAYRENIVKTVCKKCESSCLVGVGLEKRLFPLISFIIKKSLL